MKVQRIWAVDICRDGGSYSLCFDADDGRWYELFLQAQLTGNGPPVYQPPVIYLEGVNGGQAVQALTWHETKQLISPLKYDSPRFTEMRKVIAAEGNTAPLAASGGTYDSDFAGRS